MGDNYLLNTQLLKEPVSFSELLNTGVLFEVDAAHDDDARYDIGDDVDDDDGNGEDVNCEDLVTPWKHSFEELRKLMTPCGEHMHKRITRVGVKDKGVVPPKARVSLRYSAYWENEGAPFDSSMLRGNKFEFETGKGAVLAGLEKAVLTMYVFEQAEFLISFKLLFHEMGCPPRIKPRADGLFRIEILEFSLIGDEQSLDNIAPEDRCKFSFVYPSAEDMNVHGKDCVKRGRYRNAISAFENAISSLNYCRLADENEEQKQTELLIKLYTNVMICYNKINKSSKACTAMNALRVIAKGKLPCKAIFQEGRALCNLGEYERARQSFLKAKAMQPNNKEISAEIIKMEQRVSKYKQTMREIWTRALAKKKDPEEKKPDDEDNKAYAKLKTDFQNVLNTFNESSISSINMNRTMYTDKEFEILCLLSAKNNLKLSSSPIDPDQFSISKQLNK